MSVVILSSCTGIWASMAMCLPERPISYLSLSFRACLCVFTCTGDSDPARVAARIGHVQWNWHRTLSISRNCSLLLSRSLAHSHTHTHTHRSTTDTSSVAPHFPATRRWTIRSWSHREHSRTTTTSPSSTTDSRHHSLPLLLPLVLVQIRVLLLVI